MAICKTIFEEPITINESVCSVYTNNDIAVKQKVFIAEYVPRFLDDPYLDLAMEIDLTVTNKDEFIHYVYLTFQDPKPREVILLPTMLNPINLTIVDVRYGGVECYINLASVDYAREAYFSIQLFHWFLRTPSTQNSIIRIMVEITYFNGTAYNRLIQPFELTASAVKDSNNCVI